MEVHLIPESRDAEPPTPEGRHRIVYGAKEYTPKAWVTAILETIDVSADDVAERLKVALRVLQEDNPQPVLEHFRETCKPPVDEPHIATFGVAAVPTLIKMLSASSSDRLYAATALYLMKKIGIDGAKQAIPALQQAFWAFDDGHCERDDYEDAVGCALRAMREESLAFVRRCATKEVTP